MGFLIASSTLLPTLAPLAVAAFALAAFAHGTLAEGSAPNEPHASAEATPFKVMSFNIRYGTANDGENSWSKRRPYTMAMLKGESPDLIGIQEALHDQIEAILQEMPEYDYIGVGRDDGVHAGEYSAILFKKARFKPVRTDTFWLSDTPKVPGSMSWGNRITRICTWADLWDRKDERLIRHFNVHLDHESQPSREKAIALISREMSEHLPNAPTILTGDFNVGEENPVTSVARAAGLKDTFRIVHPDAKTVGTFHGFQAVPGKDKIDYVWIDGGFSVRAAELVRTKPEGHWPSDHLPVTATLVATAPK